MKLKRSFFLLVFQVTLHFFVFFTLRVFDFPFVRVIDFGESFGFFAFALVDAVFVRNEDRQRTATRLWAITFFDLFPYSYTLSL